MENGLPVKLEPRQAAIITYRRISSEQ